MADPTAQEGDWFSQLPRAPGETPDVEYVQSPADNLWYQVPKAPPPWEPPPAPPPEPEQPGFLSKFAGAIHPSEMLHEGTLANLGRTADRYQFSSTPIGKAAESATSAMLAGSPLLQGLTAVARVAMNRRSLIPESDEQIAANEAQPQGFQGTTWEGIKKGASEIGPGLQAFASGAVANPGATLGGLVQSLGERPELMLAPEGAAARAAAVAESAARAARLGDAAAVTAKALGHVAGSVTSFGALMAGSEAIHQLGETGEIDPEKLTSSAGQGALLGPVMGVLQRSLLKPTIRTTFESLMKSRMGPGEAAPGESAGEVGGPPSAPSGEGSTTFDNDTGEPVKPVGTLPEPAVGNTLGAMVQQARESGVAHEDLQPVMSARLRRQISDQEARDQVQSLIEAVKTPKPKEPISEEPKTTVPAEAVGGAAAAEAAQKPVAAEQPVAKGIEPTAEEPKAPVAAPESKADQIIVQAPLPDEHGVVRTEVAGQPVAVNVQPSPLQAARGNYLKAPIKIQGIPIMIENPKGTERSGVGSDGKPWTSTLQNDYGYIKRTVGADGDQVDTFIGPNPHEADKVYVIDQHHPDGGGFDEHKAMLGFDSRQDAIEAYQSNYPKGWSGAKAATAMTVDGFKDWLANGNTREPARAAAPTLREKIEASKVSSTTPSEAQAPPATGSAAEKLPESPPVAALPPQAPGESQKPIAPAPETISERSPLSTAKDFTPQEHAALKDMRDQLANPTVGSGHINKYRSIYEQHIGAKTVAANKGLHEKRAEELTELAIVQTARAHVEQSATPHEAFGKLVDLYNRQPNLNKRTSTSIEQQAYSTPAPLAYVASHLAGINKSTTVLEPTAGNGMLLIGANPRLATVNELNPERANALRHQGFNVTQVDATKADFGPPVQVVIENPPFGVVREQDGSSRKFTLPMPGGSTVPTTEIDHAIVMHSLESMMDDGKAVLIIGGINKLVSTEEGRSDAYNGSAKRKFFYALYNQYNVTDHFTVAGELYAKQGAAWPVDVIQIQGRGKSTRKLPAVDVPRVYDSWEGLKPLLEVSHEQPSRLESGAGEQRPGNLQHPVSPGPGTNALPVPEPTVGSYSNDAGQDSRPIGSSADTGENAGERGAVERPAVAGEPERSSEPAGVVEPEPSAAPVQPGPAVGSGEAQADRDATGETATGVGQGEPIEPPAGLGERRVSSPLVEGAQQPYAPTSKAKAIGTLVPTNMSTAVTAALNNLQDKVGQIDHYVARELGYDPAEVGKYFSGEQIDALGMALLQMKADKGYIIGDQTGIGKGRVVAGVIRWALKNGRTPIFVTEKPNLYADMYRDLSDIAVQPIRPIMTDADKKIPLDPDGNVVLKTGPTARHAALLRGMAESASLGEHNMIFTTYNQMQTVAGKATERSAFLNAFAGNAVVIFDESHNAGGTDVRAHAGHFNRELGIEGGDRLGRAGFARALAGQAKAVFYSSATYAKRPEVMDLYFKTDMAMAVDNNVRKLPGAIAAGGVPLQQAVAAMLTEAGQYVRRERSFEGVQYNTPIVPVNRTHAETISAVMMQVHQFDKAKKDAIKQIKKDMKADASAIRSETSGSGGSAATASSTNFTSIMHNVIDQMLLTLKADAGIELAIKALKNGEAPVLTVSNTMGSFIDEYAKNAGLKGGDRLGLSFKDLLMRYLESARDVTIKPPTGGSFKRRLTDEELGPHALAKFNSIRKMIKGATHLESVPISPIDWMHFKLQKAGYTTSEITGRTATIKYRDNGEQTFQIRPNSETSVAGKLKTIRNFNTAKTDVIILNQSGATGLSLHASERNPVEGRKRRRMIIVQAEKNIDTHMQMLGRVHRTGQVVAPAYDQLVADIPAEKRPAAVLAKKMASLNANTTGARSSQFTAKDSLDFINQYGDEAAAQLMQDMPELHERLGDPLDEAEGSAGGFVVPEAARKVTGRLPLLPVADQEAIYDMLSESYNELLARANALGENALEAKTLALDARPVSKTELFSGRAGSDSPFARGADAETMDVKRLGKPYTAQQVQQRLAERVSIGKDVPLGTLQALSAQQWKVNVQEVRGQFFEYRTAEESHMSSSEMPAEAQAGRLSALDGNLSRWLERAEALIPGRTYRMRTPEGTDYYGLLQRITRKKGVKLPVALGSWLAHFDVADGMREITFPFSKISLGDRGDNQISGVSVERMSNNDLTRMPIMQMFDEGQTSSRERRVIVTGNLLAGFSKVKRGQITNFTDHEGAVRQGILMPRNFDLQEFSASQPVKLTGDQVVRFLRDTPDGIVRSADGVLHIVVGQDGIFVSTPKSKAEGGQYFLDKDLREITGDFVSRGNRMWATVEPNDVPRIAEVLQTKFQQSLYTDNHREEAIKAGGTSLGGAAKKTVAMAIKRPTLALKDRTNPEVYAYLQKIAASLKGVANVYVHASTKAFGEAIGMDVPMDVYGAYTDDNDEPALHFIASMLKNVDVVQAIFRHEGFGHFAMEKSPDFAKALAMVMTLKKAGSKLINALWREVERNYPKTASDTYKAKEVIALLAERGIKNAIVDRAITGVLETLRKLGMSIQPADAELRHMIVQAARGLPAEARKLSGIDRGAAYDVEQAVQRGEMGKAQDAMGRVLPESEAIDALSYARRHKDSQAILVLKDLSADAPGDVPVGTPEPTEEDAYHPAEASVPKGILFARHAPMDPDAKAAKAKVMPGDGRDDLSLNDRVRLGVKALVNVDGLAMRQSWIDDLASLERYERDMNGNKLQPGESSPLKAARSVRNLASQMTAALAKGIPEHRDGAFHVVPGRKGISEMLKPLNAHPDGSLITHFEMYAGARVASVLITLKNKDGTLKEKNFGPAEIEAGLALADTYPELREVFDDVQKMWKQLLDLGEKAGTIDPVARAIYEWRPYMPMYRLGDESRGAGNRPRGGIANQREMSGRLTGKAAPVRNLLENMLMNVANQLDAAQKNIANQKVLDAYQGVFAKKIPKDVEAVKVSNEQVERAMKALGLNFDPEMSEDQRAMWSTFFRRVAPTDRDVVRVMRGGKPEYHRISDPLVLDALTAIQGSPKWLRDLDNRMFGLLSGPKRLYTAMSTATPLYTARRFVRVMLDTWMQSNEKLMLVKNAHKDFYDALIGHPDLYDMMMAGAGGAQGYDSDPERVRDMLIKSYKDGNKQAFVLKAANPKTWWDTWRKIQNASKNEHMLRVYRAARAKGASVAESAFRARDIEDLSMHGGGPIMQFINRTVPFLNPRIQGTYRMVRGFQDNWKAYALRGAAVTMGTLGLQALNWDNPKYQELPQWQKDVAWHAFIGDHHFMLPKPFELGLIFATLPERLVAAGMHAAGKAGGDTSSESLDALKRAVLDTFALNPVPQVLRPFLEQATNTDAFGNTIVSGTNEGVEPQEQYTPYTSPTVREIASHMPGSVNYALNSPVRLQALIQSITGSLGLGIVEGADVLTRKALGYGDAPSTALLQSAVKSFYQSGEPNTTKYTSELYDFMGEADKAYASVMKVANDSRMESAQTMLQDRAKLIELRPLLNDLGKAMKSLSKQEAAVVHSPDLTADDKQKAILELTKQRNDVARQVAPFEDFF